MGRTHAGLVVIAVAFLAGPLTATEALAQQAAVLVPNGFMSGNEYLQRSELEQRFKVQGLVEGIYLAPMLGAPNNSAQRVQACLLGMTDEQIRLILAKHLAEHPETLDQGVHTLFYTALKQACAARGKPF